MAYTAVMLIGLYVLLITLLVAAGASLVTVIVTVAIAVLVHYFTCDRLALAALGARELSCDRAPELHAALERLCALTNRPVPQLALLTTLAPNAFTIGRSSSTATICVTDGLLSLLPPVELDAVLAHELTHVGTRDVMVMTIGSIFASLAAFIVRMGRRLDPRPPRWPQSSDSPFFLVVILAGLVFLLSYVVIQPLSRRRELTADRRAASLTGGPGPLGSALCRIAAALEDDGAQVPGCWGELGALAVFAPDVPATVATIFPTHPLLEDRLVAFGARAPELA